MANPFKRKKYSKHPQSKMFNNKKYVKWSEKKNKAEANKSKNRFKDARSTRIIHNKSAKKPYAVYLGPHRDEY